MTAQTLIGKKPIRRALISVYDKSGLIPLAQGLHEAGVDIVSTGSTAKTIADKGIPVTPVELVTGFPEVLDGRVKTLHPHVHAGLLADTRNPEHVAALAKLNIEPFDLVVVNLYPFSETVDSGAEIDECVEQIDIGGPSMVRAAAKNHASVAVVVEPLGYDGVLAAVRDGGFTLEDRKKLASLAFRHTAQYDIAVANWMASVLSPEADDKPAQLPAWLGRNWRRTAVLRYGENPHQQAALYSDDIGWPGLAQAQQLHGKDMSYNNFTDADAAWRAAFDHQQICVAIIKHANPCGIAISHVSVADAHRKAHDCDPLSAFGGVVAANTEVTREMAEAVSEIFTEVIIAPAYEEGAVEILARKKNIRVLVAAEPALAEALGLEANDPSTLTPVEQEEFPLPSLALDESLARVSWTDDVSGAAIAVERLLLPPSAERDLDTDDPEQLQRLAAGHPARREVRIAVAVLRTGQRTSLIRLRAPAVAPTAEGDTATDPTSDGDEIVTGTDLAPGLAEALLATFS